MPSRRPFGKVLTRGLLLAAVLAMTGSGEPSLQVEATAGGGAVFTARVEAPITPVSADFIERAIREAGDAGAVCLVIELDTPGGLMESTRQIVKNILASRVPIVVYVSPRGARAASAGVFITLASHVAAMAPATHIGAAHPVQIGGPGQGPQETEGESDENGGDVMEEKIVNDARAWAQSLADLRGRNAEWAAAAVTKSESIPSTEALRLNVIEYLADDLSDLLEKIDGLEIQTQAGTVTLQTAGASVEEVEMWWGEKVLSLLSDPNLAFLLLMLGFYGILFEFYTPGWGVAGTTGAICLVLAFFGLAVLPINYAGLVLIVISVGLFVAEAFFPSFGMLTVGGAICLILGGIMLVDSPIPVMRVSTAVVVPVAIGSGLVAFFLAGRAFQSFGLPVQTGAEAMAGMRGRASGDFVEWDGQYEGTVLVHGELWRAESSQAIVDGQAVTVEECVGLTLTVKGSAGSGRPNPAGNQDQ